jgi:hypothetical protein
MPGRHREWEMKLSAMRSFAALRLSSDEPATPEQCCLERRHSLLQAVGSIAPDASMTADEPIRELIEAGRAGAVRYLQDPLPVAS